MRTRVTRAHERDPVRDQLGSEGHVEGRLRLERRCPVEAAMPPHCQSGGRARNGPGEHVPGGRPAEHHPVLGCVADRGRVPNGLVVPIRVRLGRALGRGEPNYVPRADDVRLARSDLELLRSRLEVAQRVLVRVLLQVRVREGGEVRLERSGDVGAAREGLIRAGAGRDTCVSVVVGCAA